MRKHSASVLSIFAMLAFMSPANLNAQTSNCDGLTLDIAWGCLGESSGWAAIDGFTGTVGSTSILWSTGQTNTQFIHGLPSGEYWVMVTDEAECFIKDVFSVDCEKDCDLEVVVAWGCLGESNGWAAIDDIFGATPPTEILWSTGQTNMQFITGLASGPHWVMVTDSEGCVDKAYFTVDCEKEHEPCELRTQTMGGWGSPANGNNNGAYRNANFAGAFPGGLTIGGVCPGGYTLSLTSAAAVQAFLPSGSTARALTQSYTNPGNSYKNVLAGQLVALTLSVGFDTYDPNFGASGVLADAVLNNGPLQGYTVQELLDEANKFIAGCGSSFTASQLNDALSMVNENYNGGNTDKGHLDCTAVVGYRIMMEETAAPVQTRTFPVPTSDVLNVEVMSTQDGVITMIVMDALGRTVLTHSNEAFMAGEQRTVVLDLGSLNNGSYLLTLLRDGNIMKTDRVIISR